ncbi:MAG: alpha-L-fucosidase [Muribaculaceae bacterium]
MSQTKHLLCVAVATLLLSQPLTAQQKMNEMWGNSNETKTKETSNQRGHLFEWGNYAMFIHWGLFSHLGNVWNGRTYYGIGEWMMNEGMANADRGEYMAVAKQFNPSQFDAMKIAQLAKDAGMKYIIITSKHHDGFAMYHSACNKFNIVDATPFHRDPMKELSEACKALGLGFGFYYSHNQDWTTPGGSGGPSTDANGNKKTFDDYFYSKCLPQVEEITKNYGDIELIWFDTPGGMPQKYAKELVDVVHRNQPKAFVSGRVGYDMGDYQTFGDMEVPIENVSGLWESVDVTNDAWGYAWYDNNWKTPKQIVQNLVSTVARGGTYMLNIGPDGKGNVPDFAVRSLVASGKWINSHQQVVCGTDPSPWKHALPWGDVVKKGNKLYLTVFNWPSSGKLYLPGLQSKIKSAALLNNGKAQRIKFNQDDLWTVFQLPLSCPDNLCSVIELTLSTDSPVVDNTIAIDPEIGLEHLSVKLAKTDNCNCYKSSWMEKFGEWKHMYCVNNLNKGGTITWTVKVKTPGVYAVSLEARGNGRAVWRLTTDENHLAQNQQSVASKFTQCALGWLEFDKAGTHTITLTMPEGGITADVASISLTPVAL